MTRHYSRRTVTPYADRFELVFPNEHTGAEVKLTVPKTGAYEDPARQISQSEVEELADHLAHVLKEKLA